MTNEEKLISSAFDTFMDRKNWSSYAGEWIAICENKVVSSDTDLKKVIKESTKKCGDKHPTFTKIPGKYVAMIL